MSADLNTSIILKGTPQELLAMLKILKKFETEKAEQYKTNRDCSYIEWVNVEGTSGECRPKQMSDAELFAFVENAGISLDVTASGPWGIFCEPGEAGLFEALADVAPNAYFNGIITGFVSGADVVHSGELKEGKLYLSDVMINDEEFPELYASDFKKKLSYAKFCKLFKVDKEEFDSDCYFDFIMEASEEGFPTEMDFDTFLEFCDSSEMDEEQYDTAIEKICQLGIVDYETFCESIDRDDYAEKQVYDPKTQSYKKGTGGTNCEGLVFVVTGKLTEFKNRAELTDYIESQGGNVTGSVSQKTNYLINNDSSSQSSKNQKAKELGVSILTESEFINMFGRS